MSDKAEIDVIRRVYGPFSDGNFLEIRPWPDSPQDTLELHVTKECQQFFGPLSLTMNVEFAEALGRALLASVEDLRLAEISREAQSAAQCARGATLLSAGTKTEA
jgi:hypothetical protein